MRQKLKVLLEAKFAPALAGAPVPGTRPYVYRGSLNKQVVLVLKESGAFHPFHQQYRNGGWERWETEDSGSVEIVLILGEQKETLQDTKQYTITKNGATQTANVASFRYDMDARLVEASTGKTLATKHFESIPRPLGTIESIKTIGGVPIGERVGRSIQFSDVNEWLATWATAAKKN